MCLIHTVPVQDRTDLNTPAVDVLCEVKEVIPKADASTEGQKKKEGQKEKAGKGKKSSGMKGQ